LVAVTHLTFDAGLRPVLPFLVQITLPLRASMTAPVNDVPNRAVVTRAVSLLAIRLSAAEFVYAVTAVGAAVTVGAACADGATSRPADRVRAKAAATADVVRRWRGTVRAGELMPGPWDWTAMAAGWLGQV
jgi:hypothetical protein